MSLPTPEEMLGAADLELSRAYVALSEAADVLRSDWPAGMSMTSEQAKRRTRIFRAITAAKAAIDKAR